MIKLKTSRADLEKFIQKKLIKLEAGTISRLQALGEDCVQRSREAIQLNAAAFPVAYLKNAKPLRQRHISQRDLDKNPNVKPPKFGEYLDQTGNLRDSIGYVIVKDGKVIKSHLGSQGADNVNAMIAKSAAKIPKGYGLIVVAGMEYAAAVESKGYDVLTSSEHWAKKQMPKLIQALKKSIK